MSGLPQYQEYPKWLRHPGEMPAIVSDDSEKGAWNLGHEAPKGRPIQFPPVQVNNPDQEAYYVSKGYAGGDTTDPAEWQKRVVAPRVSEGVEYPRYNAKGEVELGPNPPQPIDRNYPKWVTLADGSQAIAKDAEDERRLVPPPEPSEAEREFLAALAEAERISQSQSADDGIEHLRHAAAANGIAVDRRWGEARLRQEITTARERQNEAVQYTR